jgi:hypothetical protein
MKIAFLGTHLESCNRHQTHGQKKEHGDSAQGEIFANNPGEQARFSHGVPHFRLHVDSLLSRATLIASDHAS